MRFISIGIAALLALPLPVSAHGPAKQTTERTGLTASARAAAATVDSFHAALKRGDTRAAAALLAEDAVIFEEGGVERTKAEYVASHLPADAAFSKVVPSTMTRRSGGANGGFAWIAS